MPFRARNRVAAQLDLMVYEDVIVAWCAHWFSYEILLPSGEVINPTRTQTAMWVDGAMAVYLSMIKKERLKPRIPRD